MLEAAKNGDLKTVQVLVIKNKYLVYEFDTCNQTALHWAVKRGHNKIVEHLLKHGADVNAIDIVIAKSRSIDLPFMFCIVAKDTTLLGFKNWQP